MDDVKTVSLQWKHHHSNLQTMFPLFLGRGDFCDVTLACEGQTLMAHRMVLCASSTYFQSILTEARSFKDTIVVLRDYKFIDINCLIEFMYNGEVAVHPDNLTSVLKAAKDLEIKGLAAYESRKDHTCNKRSYESSAIPHEGIEELNARKRDPSPNENSFKESKIPKTSGIQSTQNVNPFYQTENDHIEDRPELDIVPKSEMPDSPPPFEEDPYYSDSQPRSESSGKHTHQGFEVSFVDPTISSEYGPGSTPQAYNMFDIEQPASTSKNPSDVINTNPIHLSLRKDLVDSALITRALTANSTNFRKFKPFHPLTRCDCNRRCETRISIERQQEINASFCRMGYKAEKIAFLRSNFEEQQPNMSPMERTVMSRKYYLSDENSIRHRVCKRFFLNVFQLNSSSMERVLTS